MDAHRHGRKRFGYGRFITRLRWPLLTAIAVLAFAGAATAVPYPAGKEDGSTAGGSGVLSLSASFAGGIVPGRSEPVTFTAANSGNSPVYLRTLHLVGVSVDGSHAACVTSDFSMRDVTEHQWVDGHAGAEALPNEGTLIYAETGTNQDACHGATLTLTLARQ